MFGVGDEVAAADLGVLQAEDVPHRLGEAGPSVDGAADGDQFVGHGRRAFLDETIGAADEATGFLQQNSRHLVTLAGRQRPVLDLVAEYSRGLPCLFDALATFDRAGNRVMGGPGRYMKVSIDMFVDRRTHRGKGFAEQPARRGRRAQPAARGVVLGAVLPGDPEAVREPGADQPVKSTPGLRIPCGSSACLIARMVARSTGDRLRAVQPVLARPTPCSALMLPP